MESQKFPAPILVHHDYSNYNMERRRMSAGNEVMKQFQKDLNEVQDVRVQKTEFGPGPTPTFCQHCKTDVTTSAKTDESANPNIIRRLQYCFMGGPEVKHTCPICKKVLGTYKS